MRTLEEQLAEAKAEAAHWRRAWAEAQVKLDTRADPEESLIKRVEYLEARLAMLLDEHGQTL